MKKFVGAFVAAVLGLSMYGLVNSPVALARVLGNPATDSPKSSVDVGLGLSSVAKEFDTKIAAPQVCYFGICAGGGTVSGSSTESVKHTSVFLDYVILNGGSLRGEFAQSSYGVGSSTGSEFGLNYRQNFSTKTLASGKTLTLAGLVGYESGSLSSDNSGVSYTGSYSEYQLAFGGSVALQKGFNVYAAGIFDNFDGSISGSGSKSTFTSKDPLGVYGGADYMVTPEIRVGGEYHLLFETGWAIYGSFMF